MFKGSEMNIFNKVHLFDYNELRKNNPPKGDICHNCQITSEETDLVEFTKKTLCCGCVTPTKTFYKIDDCGNIVQAVHKVTGDLLFNKDNSKKLVTLRLKHYVLAFEDGTAIVFGNTPLYFPDNVKMVKTNKPMLDALNYVLDNKPNNFAFIIADDDVPVTRFYINRDPDHLFFSNPVKYATDVDHFHLPIEEFKQTENDYLYGKISLDDIPNSTIERTIRIRNIEDIEIITDADGNPVINKTTGKPKEKVITRCFKNSTEQTKKFLKRLRE